jgi:hypothetical protein
MKLVLATLAGLAMISTGASAAENKTWDIGQVLCKDIMIRGDRERELAMAYYHGYLDGKANATTLDVNAKAALTDKVMEHCVSNPNDTLLSVFSK